MGILKGVLKERDMSIKDVAKEINVDSQTITNWDKGKTHPSVSQFKQLADCIGIDFDELRKRVYQW